MGEPSRKPAERQPTDEELDHAASVLHLLSDRTRLGIVSLLRDDRELSVGDIAARLDRPLPAVSQHLAKLRSGRLVIVRRDGTSMKYRVGGEHVSLLVENLLRHAEHELFTDPPHHRDGSL